MYLYICKLTLDRREIWNGENRTIQPLFLLKNVRATVPDGIPSELLKYAEEPVSRTLHELFHKVWITGRVPIEWKEGVIVSLYKEKGA